MKIKILRRCQGVKGILRPGNIIDMPDLYANAYVNQGLAQRVKEDHIAEERKTKVVEPEQKKMPKKRGRKPKNYENTSIN